MDENKRNLVYQEEGTEIKISPTGDTSALMTVSQDIKHTLREETHWLYTIVGAHALLSYTCCLCCTEEKGHFLP